MAFASCGDARRDRRVVRVTASNTCASMSPPRRGSSQRPRYGDRQTPLSRSRRAARCRPIQEGLASALGTEIGQPNDTPQRHLVSPGAASIPPFFTPAEGCGQTPEPFHCDEFSFIFRRGSKAPKPPPGSARFKDWCARVRFASTSVAFIRVSPMIGASCLRRGPGCAAAATGLALLLHAAVLALLPAWPHTPPSAPEPITLAVAMVQAPVPPSPAPQPMVTPAPKPSARRPAAAPPMRVRPAQLSDERAAKSDPAPTEPPPRSPEPEVVAPTPPEHPPLSESRSTEPAAAPVQADAAAAAPAHAAPTQSAPPSAPLQASALACSVPQPAYPRIARLGGWQGRVNLLLSIAANGSVEDAQVRRSSGYAELDAAALQAARAGRCAPQPQPVRATLTIHYRLQ